MKDTTGPGPGARASDVNDDMVMARGLRDAGAVDVHTTTECVSRRIRARSCSGRGRDAGSEADECGCTEGAVGGAIFQARELGEGEAWKHLVGRPVGVG